MKTRLIWITPSAESIIAYCARVSSPNQENPEVSGLLSYCIRHEHWSVFEMASMCVEIETSRAISAQILRHRSFSFQEFSQRYAVAQHFEKYKARRQALKNRQSSVDDMTEGDIAWFNEAQRHIHETASFWYGAALQKDIAKEQARFLLPMSTSTRLYMSGTIRSWIHYLRLRTQPNTQQEHREIALSCQAIFNQELPVIGGLL